MAKRTRAEWSVSAVEDAIGKKTEEWKGNCYSVACACVDAKVVKGVAVYGHYIGHVAETSFFAEKRGLGFVQHGWVQLPDKSVWDPTRWVFEDVKPYIYVGPAGRTYDEGGNTFRSMMRRPPPAFDETEQLYVLDQRVLPSAGAWGMVEGLLSLSGVYSERPDLKMGTVTVGQIFWLSNLPYEDLAPHTPEVYAAIVAVGMEAAIPIDNYRRSLRERSAKAAR